MPAFIGFGLALFVAAFARISGFDRDRAFYPVVLIVIAAYYVLFAAMAGGGADLRIELAVFALFAATAVFGFRTSLWIAAAGLALHGVFDATRHLFLAGRGVPEWWPGFCLAFDLAAAAALGAILLLERRRSAPPGPQGGERR